MSHHADMHGQRSFHGGTRAHAIWSAELRDLKQDNTCNLPVKDVDHVVSQASVESLSSCKVTDCISIVQLFRGDGFDSQGVSGQLPLHQWRAKRAFGVYPARL